MIPKIFHVVWLGNPMPPRELSFLNNNKQILSDYKSYCWTDETLDKLLSGEPYELFVKKAIANRKFAFAADAIKLAALDKFGGWSLDADNEILQPLEKFEHHNWVSGFEKYKTTQAPITALWGSVPEHNFTKRLLKAYRLENYDLITSIPNTRWISDVLIHFGAVNNNQQQRIENLDVDLYPSEVFCGPFVKGLTCAMHHFNGSWL